MDYQVVGVRLEVEAGACQIAKQAAVPVAVMVYRGELLSAILY